MGVADRISRPMLAIVSVCTFSGGILLVPFRRARREYMEAKIEVRFDSFSLLGHARNPGTVR